MRLPESQEYFSRYNDTCIAVTNRRVYVAFRSCHCAFLPELNIPQAALKVGKVKQEDASRIQAEYDRLVQGLAAAGHLDEISVQRLSEGVQAPAVAVPGNIRRAEHFLSLLGCISYGHICELCASLPSLRLPTPPCSDERISTSK